MLRNWFRTSLVHIPGKPDLLSWSSSGDKYAVVTKHVHKSDQQAAGLASNTTSTNYHGELNMPDCDLARTQNQS